MAPVTLKIPEGTQSGKELRVRGRGMPFLNEKGRGDLVVRSGGADSKEAEPSATGTGDASWPSR
jgi:DnaJ-class molecular chaperone